MLKQKARQLAAEQGRDFNPSDGWFSWWKAQCNVVQHKDHGEKQDLDVMAATELRADILPTILEQYQPHDVFRADQTGVSYLGFPDRGHAMLKEGFAGGKKSYGPHHIALLCKRMGLRSGLFW